MLVFDAGIHHVFTMITGTDLAPGSHPTITFGQCDGTFGSLTFRRIKDNVGPDIRSLCGQAGVGL
jgi:hypothetical protein